MLLGWHARSGSPQLVEIFGGSRTLGGPCGEAALHPEVWLALSS
jgi:hypothetical protein